MRITKPDCVFVALVIQNAVRMRYITICSLPCCTRLSTLSPKRHDFPKKKKKVIEHKIVFQFSRQLLSELFFILRTTERDKIKNDFWFSCKVPVIIVRF